MRFVGFVVFLGSIQNYLFGILLLPRCLGRLTPLARAHRPTREHRPQLDLRTERQLCERVVGCVSPSRGCALAYSAVVEVGGGLYSYPDFTSQSENTDYRQGLRGIFVMLGVGGDTVPHLR